MINHNPLNYTTYAVKRLKSLEFRSKFGREGRTRKKRERENSLPLFKLQEVSILCESLFLYSHISCHHGPHRLLSAASLPSGHKRHLFLSSFSARQAQPEISQMEPKLRSSSAATEQLLPSKRLKGGSCIFTGSPCWEILKLGSMSHPYDLTLRSCILVECFQSISSPFWVKHIFLNFLPHAEHIQALLPPAHWPLFNHLAIYPLK